MTHRRLTRLLVSLVYGMLLTLPASGLAQEATPDNRECVPNELDGSCLPLAPEGDRVDRATPVFSNPTSITNPLFPISDLESSLLMGTVDDLPFRVEVTLLPYTNTIEWNGQQVETLVSQYAAYLDGRILEVAVDWYAQADDGSVWYFGEDVFNYEDGVVADTDGTWLAEKDGPAGMIMPADPQVGDVYRPENIPGLVFEEVTVKATDVTVDGPLGPVSGAIVVTELHQDGTYEDKTFAPGYGEFLTGGGGELEAIALAVPHDAIAGPPSTELETLVTGATAIDEAVQAGAWEDVAATLATMNAAWETLGATAVPSWLADQMSAALAGLNESVEAADAAGTRQAAIDVGQAALDLELRHLPITQINLARFGLWVRQVAVDATASDGPALAGDVATMEWVWGRVAHLADESTAEHVEEHLTALRTAVEAGNLAVATSVAEDLHALVQQIDPR
jgi:hypothetical protein